jgi:hypothetical protein
MCPKILAFGCDAEMRQSIARWVTTARWFALPAISPAISTPGVRNGRVPYDPTLLSAVIISLANSIIDPIVCLDDGVERSNAAPIQPFKIGRRSAAFRAG